MTRGTFFFFFYEILDSEGRLLSNLELDLIYNPTLVFFCIFHGLWLERTLRNDWSVDSRDVSVPVDDSILEPLGHSALTVGLACAIYRARWIEPSLKLRSHAQLRL